MQIKYLVRDIFTGLRPHLKLCKNLDEAKEALNDLQKKLLAKLEPVSSATAPKKDSDHQQQLSTILEGEWENAEDGETGARESTQDEGSNDVNSNDNKDDEDEGEDEYEDDEQRELDDEYQGFPPESIFDFTDTMTPRKRRIDVEDEAFADAFDRMVSDDIQDRMRETIKPQQIDISVPYNVRNSLKKNYEQLQQAAAEDAAAAASAMVPKASVNFVVLLRKGNKQQYKNLEIPLDSDLAKNLKSQERAERVEMEKVKRLTLDINERLEEEDYQEQMLTYSQKQIPSASNREKKKKFQHLKGAPDADLIFGKKKVQYK